MANDKLTTYKAKRDFQKTREPSGHDPVKPTTRRRFVIQKHDATRLHYDLRLRAGWRLQILGCDQRTVARSQ